MSRLHKIQFSFFVSCFLAGWLFFFSSTFTARAQSHSSLPFLSDSADFLWPTDASPYMSATFGETRSSHFHAALDIKTWGRRGYKVFATRDGILHRVGIDAYGYGNVIYLKHEDGSYSVYAHLLDFIPRIRTLVDSLRMETYSFLFDQNLESYNITFKRGEVIGFTGASGIGPPHLHFELRTPGHKPYNPLLTNIEVEDHRPPRFSGLSIEPLSADATIESGKELVIKKPTWRNGFFDFGTVDVKGTVGLGVDVFDQADRVANVYAVYELRLLTEERVWFHSKVDSFSYDNTHQMFIDRVYPILKRTRQGYQRLYIADGNTLPFYKETYNRGRIRLSPGRHTFIIEAKDYYGNTARGKIRLNIDEPANPTDMEEWKIIHPDELLAGTALNSTDIVWNNDWMVFRQNSKIAFRPMSVLSFRRTVSAHSSLVPLGSTGPYPILIEPEASDRALLHRILPNERTTIHSPDQKMELMIPRGSVYDTLSLGVNYEIQADSIRINVYPHAEPLKSAMKVKLLVDTSKVRLKRPIVYWYNERTDHLYPQKTQFSGNIVTAELESFGTHYVINDTIPPDVNRPRIRRRKNGKWIVVATVIDKQSGIDFESSRFYCNDLRGIAEYDPGTRQLIYYRPDFLPKPTNVCTVSVFDVAGNRTDSTFTLTR